MTQPAAERVYVLGTADGRTVKIGRTTNLAKRVSDIQGMSPVPLTLLWSHPGGHALETNLHRHFSWLRVHGEWFVFKEDALPLIKKAVKDKPWLRPKVDLKKRRSGVAQLTGEQRKARREAAAAKGVELPPALVTAMDAIVATVRSIEDPLEFYKASLDAEARVKAIMKDQQRKAASQLRDEGKSWREIGEVFHVSSQRAFQIASGQ